MEYGLFLNRDAAGSSPRNGRTPCTEALRQRHWADLHGLASQPATSPSDYSRGRQPPPALLAATKLNVIDHLGAVLRFGGVFSFRAVYSEAAARTLQLIGMAAEFLFRALVCSGLSASSEPPVPNSDTSGYLNTLCACLMFNAGQDKISNESVPFNTPASYHAIGAPRCAVSGTHWMPKS